MAGVIGIVSSDKQAAVSDEEVSNFAAAFQDIRGRGPERALQAGEWAKFSIIGAGASPTVEVEDDSWFGAVGAVHGNGRLCANRLEELDGQFAGARYDAESGDVEVFTDFFGMQPMYMATHHERSYFSTSATALARHLRARPDRLGMRVFLRSGYQIGPATLWEGIDRLEPGTVISCAGHAPRRRTSWLPRVDERVRAMNLGQTIEHCVGVFVDVVRRRLASGPAPWVDLTGGFDSRMVAAVVSHAGVEFTASTNGAAESADVRLAEQVAAAGGFAWQRISLPHGWTMHPESARLAAGWSDGTLDVFHLAEVLESHAIKAAKSRHVVTGGGGEHFNSFPWQQEFLQAGRRRQVNYSNLLNMRYLKQADTSMLSEQSDEDVAQYFRDTLSQRAAHYSDHPNTTQLDAIYAYKSVGHFGAYRAASEALVRTEIPCYYREIFATAFSVHHRWRNNHRVQRGIIERLSPAMASVPTTRGGTAQPIRARNVHQLVPYYMSVGHRAARKLVRWGRPAGSVPTAEAKGARYRPALEHLRREGVFDWTSMHSAPLYDRDRLMAFLDRSRADDFGGWSMIGRIATLELVLGAASR